MFIHSTCRNQSSRKKNLSSVTAGAENETLFILCRGRVCRTRNSNPLQNSPSSKNLLCSGFRTRNETIRIFFSFCQIEMDICIEGKLHPPPFFLKKTHPFCVCPKDLYALTTQSHFHRRRRRKISIIETNEKRKNADGINTNPTLSFCGCS